MITAGPTFEPLDKVRRLTNFSTGRLGTELANFLVRSGHEVILLRGEQATYPGPCSGPCIDTFTTTDHLLQLLQSLAGKGFGAVFHAAAVSDFRFGKVFARTVSGGFRELAGGKLSTRDGPLLAELQPTPKILRELRPLFPEALIAGWKYEVDGGPDTAQTSARAQLSDCKTNACILNGPAYGRGFGLMSAEGGLTHLPNANALFHALAGLLKSRENQP